MEISTCQSCAPATHVPRASERDEAPGFGFRDLLGALNPLQNLPVIGAVYRHVTGATIHPAAQVVGGLIFGGPIGMFVSALSATFEQVTGKAPLTMALNALSPDRSADNAPLVADAATPFAGLMAEPEPQPEPVPNPVPPPQLTALQAQAAPALRASATQRAPAAPAAPAAAGAAAAARSVTPRAAAALSEPPAADGPSRPRIAGARDLAFYQAHAGARLPAAGGGAAPAQLPATPAAAARAQAQPAAEPPARAATSAAAPAPIAAPGAMAAPATPPAAPAQTQADFASRMLQGLERYRAMTMVGDARSPALSLTR